MKSRLLIALLVLMIGLGVACRQAIVGTPDVQVVSAAKISLEPNDSVWNNAPVHVSKLILQDLVEPRLMEPSTQEVQVRAVTDGKEIAFRIEWLDESKDDVPGPARMMDGVAVQLPAKVDVNVPAPQMGETGKTVEISYWRADWQAIVEGRADDITSIYPNAKPDHYPFDAKSLEKDPEAQKQAALRYSPARALGNGREGPRTQPVEDLIAEGPGTLSPGPNQFSKGKGARTSTGWAVVITRPVPAGFTKEAPSSIAFAVWQGAHKETGARKMRTGWVNLLMK
jgi:DMSO reductase family type II enzyme heme b subunit